METLPLHAHPTTILMVDDDLGFLRNLVLGLPPHWAIRITSSAHKAIEHIRRAPQAQPISLNQAHRRVFERARFAEPAILVADLDMPEMNGLDLCNQLQDTPLQTILLTGKADEKTAVDAFNEGLISRFISKHDPSALHKLNLYLKELHNEYFARQFPLHSATNASEAPVFATDPAFIDAFQAIVEKERIVEHYFSVNPQGILLLDEVGSAQLMTVFTEDDLRAQLEVAEDEEAPEELLNVLRNRTHLPIFRDGDNHFRKGDTYWRDALHPAHKIEGERSYYWSLLPDAAPYAIADDTVFSYANYLEQLDREGLELAA